MEKFSSCSTCIYVSSREINVLLFLDSKCCVSDCESLFSSVQSGEPLEVVPKNRGFYAESFSLYARRAIEWGVSFKEAPVFARIRKSGTYQYMQIVESNKVKGKVTQRVIATVRRLAQLLGKNQVE